MPATKRCSKCGEEFPATTEYFSPEKRVKCGLKAMCRSCYREPPEKVRKRVLDWQKANPEKVQKKNRKWQEANPEKVQESSRKYREANPEKIREGRRKHEEKNKEKIRKRSLASYYKTYEKHLETQRKSRQKHRADIAIRAQKRRVRKRGLPYELTKEDWLQALSYWQGCCVYCGKHVERLTQEHFIPISNPDCPGTVINNILPACGSCNSSKGEKEATVWLAWKFGDEVASTRIGEIKAYFEWVSKHKSP